MRCPAIQFAPPLVVASHRGVGRGGGVRRDLGVGTGRAEGVAVGVEVGVAVGVAVAVGVNVAVGVSVGINVAVAVGVGEAVASGVGVGVGPDCTQYLPPVLKYWEKLNLPPHTIISLLVQTAVL
jgi:hypothetical protein